MTIRINNWVRIPKEKLSSTELKDIKFSLTYQIVNKNPFANKNDVTMEYCYEETDTELSIPRYHGKMLYPDHVDETWSGNDAPGFKDFNLILDEPVKHQVSAYDALVKSLHDYNSAIISLPPGDGKTEVALKALEEFKKKTLVVVHSDFIGQQWLERAKKRYKNVKTGIMMGKTIDNVNDADIVAVTVQSLIKGKYSKKILEQFGIVILDELHHYSSNKWKQVFELLHCKRFIGLSGTPENAKCIDLLHAWLGPISFKSKKTYTITVNVDVYKMDIMEYPPLIMCKWNKKKLDPTSNMANLITMEQRISYILEKIRPLNDTDRQVLFLSERVDHTKRMMTECDKLYPKISKGLLIGGMSLKEQDRAKEEQWIFSTFKMSHEALDLPYLSIIVILSPHQGDIYQTVCRVIRNITFTLEPWIIDFYDPWGSFHTRFYNRHKLYIREKYNVRFHLQSDEQSIEMVENVPNEDDHSSRKRKIQSQDTSRNVKAKNNDLPDYDICPF